MSEDERTTPWDPDVFAKMDKIDALLARNRAIVASWGYEMHVPTKEERDAEWKEIEEAQKRPSHWELGYQPPKDWADGQDQEQRKRQSGSVALRKSLGLQASKPRNGHDKSMDAAGHAGDSSDEEEGRTGLGRVKRAKHVHTYEGGRGDSNDEAEAKSSLLGKSKAAKDTAKIDARLTSFGEILDNTKEDPNSAKVESWKQKTAEALVQSPVLSTHKSVFPSPDSAQSPPVKTLFQNALSQESTTFDDTKRSKKRRLSDDIGINNDIAPSNRRLANTPNVTKVSDFVPHSGHTGKFRPGGITFIEFIEVKEAPDHPSQLLVPNRLPAPTAVSREPLVKYSEKAGGTKFNEARPLEKSKKQDLQENRSREQWVGKTEKDRRMEMGGRSVTATVAKAGVEDVKSGTPMGADAETMAKMRQLARERLGSGDTGRAKVKGSNPAFAVSNEKKKKKSKKSKGNLLKVDFA